MYTYIYTYRYTHINIYTYIHIYIYYSYTKLYHNPKCIQNAHTHIYIHICQKTYVY